MLISTEEVEFCLFVLENPRNMSTDDWHSYSEIISSLFKSCVRKTSSCNCSSLSKTLTIKMNQQNNFNDKLYSKFRNINFWLIVLFLHTDFILPCLNMRQFAKTTTCPKGLLQTCQGFTDLFNSDLESTLEYHLALRKQIQTSTHWEAKKLRSSSPAGFVHNSC